MNRITLIGYVLWRAGMLLAAGAAFYFAFWWVLSAYTIPNVVKLGLGLCGTGMAALLASLVLERISDSRLEAQWKE